MGNYQKLKHLIWIDPNVDNEENKNYVANMENIGFKNIQCFKAIEDGINYLKTFKFVKKFKENMKEFF